MLDTLKTIHDTLVIRDTVWAVDSTNRFLIKDLNSFYSDNYATLIGYTALIIGVVGVVIPLVAYWISNKDARKLKKKVKAQNKMFNDIQIKFTTKIANISSEFNSTTKRIQQTSTTQIAGIYYNIYLDILFRDDKNSEIDRTNALHYICKAINICAENNTEIHPTYLNSLLMRSNNVFKKTIRKDILSDYESTVMLLENAKNTIDDIDQKKLLEKIINNIMI